MKTTKLGLVLFLLLLYSPLAPAGEADGFLPERDHVYHATLKNGVRVVLYPDDTVPRVDFKLSYRVSYCDAPYEKEGVFLAALNSIFLNIEANTRVIRSGGTWGMTRHYPDIHAQDFLLDAVDLETGVDILRGMIETGIATKISEEEFQGEIQKTSPYVRRSRRTNLLDANGFAEPFARNDTRGTPEDLQQVSAGEFLAFRKAHCCPARAQVTLTGAFPPAKTLRLLEERLGTIENPPGAVLTAQRFRRFKPGVRCVPAESNGGGLSLLLAFPLPPDISVLEADVLSDALLQDLKKEVGERGVTGRVDRRTGVRLLRFGFTGDPADVLPVALDRLEFFPRRVEDRPLDAQMTQLRRKTAFEKLRNLYWYSWQVAYEIDPLGWGWDSPWLELDDVSKIDMERIRRMCTDVIRPAHALILGVTADGEDATGLREKMETIVEQKWGETDFGYIPPRFHPFPDNPPAAQDREISTSFFNPRVQSLQEGRILFLQEPRRDWYTLKGVYPRGILEKRTRAYAAALERSVPERGMPGLLTFRKRLDRLEFELKTTGISWTETDLVEWMELIRKWISTEPDENGPAAPVPALDHVDTGEAPSWIVTVSGPRPVEELAEISLPGKPSYSPYGAKRCFSGDELQPDEKAPFDVLIPLGLSSQNGEPQAAKLLLASWFSPQGRNTRKYKHLTLPALEHSIAAVETTRVGEEEVLVIRCGEGDPEEILKWMRGQGGLEPLQSEDGLMEALRGAHALPMLSDAFASDPHSPLETHAAARMAGAEDARCFDLVREALVKMPPERFLEITAKWLEVAEIAGVQKPSETRHQEE